VDIASQNILYDKKLKTVKKIIFLFALLFSIVSYSQSDKLIGKWGNCSSTCDGLTINKNVCTEMEFKSNQTAIITYPGYVENLKWQMAGNEITFISLVKVESVTFSNSKIYILKFNETFTVLKVSEKGKEECYDLLSR
jgi:membrane glycosyltransferase